MTDNELLLSISDMMDRKLKPIEDRMGSIEGRMGSIEGRMGSMEERQTKMEILIENEVLPRLQTIESCYTSTYERYVAAADKCEKVVEDVELMKKVIAEHSDKLNRIA